MIIMGDHNTFPLVNFSQVTNTLHMLLLAILLVTENATGWFSCAKLQQQNAMQPQDFFLQKIHSAHGESYGRDRSLQHVALCMPSFSSFTV